MSKKSITFAAECKNAPARIAYAHINKEQKIDKVCAMKTKETKEQKRFSKFWEACQKFKETWIVNDPVLLA